MDYKIAKAAANWWIEAMKRKCNNSYPEKVNYDGSDFVIVDDCFAREMNRFETVLYDTILDCIRMRSCLSLTCCYRPNRALSRLITQACISTEYLPERASMQICGTSVKVSLNGDDFLRSLKLAD